jgi:glutamyl-tRNA synthetase
MTDTPIRVRMAPSPTGFLHLGGLRTALFNWLYAAHYNGTFLLRIEDTDLERSKPEFTASIIESLDWAGIQSSEPIVIQSQRLARHKQIAEQLLAEHKAYKCYCTPEELEARIGSGQGTSSESYTKYDRHCCNILENKGNKPYAIRFKIPDDIKHVSFIDLIHGEISFETNQLDDFIIIRSDGTPMYNFVVVVDDADMAITQVIRGDDHISNTPKQILLYQACDFKLPQFAHVPMILGSDGQRLSKRHAATAVVDYRKNGFLADALCNYLVRLGWSHGDQEIFNRQELINLFSLDQVGKKAAIFDHKKLEWLNGLYIRQKSGSELVQLIIRDIDAQFRTRLSSWHDEQVCAALNLYRDRVKTLCELRDEVELAYNGPQSYSDIELEKIKRDNQAQAIFVLCERLLRDQTEFSAAALAREIKAWCKEQQIALVDIAQPLRIALLGKTTSPGIFELLELIGKNESIKRLNFFIKTIYSA